MVAEELLDPLPLLVLVAVLAKGLLLIPVSACPAVIW
jgi:hypothetical protein